MKSAWLRHRAWLAALSAIVSAAIWAIFIRPIAHEPLDSPTVLFAAPFVILAAPLAVVFVAGLVEVGGRRAWRIGLAAAVGPLFLAGVALAYSDELRWQRDAIEVFDRYTTRFPDEELGEPQVRNQYDDSVTVCAPQDDPRPIEFCTEVDLTQATNSEVVGGFRYRVDELYPGAGFISAEPFDCFGDALVCESRDGN